MGYVTINEDDFGSVADPITGENQLVKRFTFTNENGLAVQVITLGATVTSIRCPDKSGNIEDVALGFDSAEGIFDAANFDLIRLMRFSANIRISLGG